ncbi:MAG: NYN domain-containing protein [Patescibacteria group bacterium]
MKCYAFIDASNLFYGGEKSLGWKIDYRKLFKYLKKKYGVSKVFYFGGVELDGYKYDYLLQDTVNLDELSKFMVEREKVVAASKSAMVKEIFQKNLQKLKFYLKLREFGFVMLLKPVKVYKIVGETAKRKANCDVDMTLQLLTEKYDRAVILSGDGDFLPVIKHIKNLGKKVYILARGARTAREIRQLAGGDFRDFEYLKYQIGMSRTKKGRLV